MVMHATHRTVRNQGTAGLKLAALACVAVLALVACSPKTETRGNIPRDYQMAQIQVGLSTMDDVIRNLGTPSTVGTFDSRTWYYIGHHAQQWAFLDKSITDAQVLAMTFDEGQVLREMKTYTEDDMREIALNSRETPTAGAELNVFQQILGNFGRF